MKEIVVPEIEITTLALKRNIAKQIRTRSVWGNPEFIAVWDKIEWIGWISDRAIDTYSDYMILGKLADDYFFVRRGDINSSYWAKITHNLPQIFIH